MTRNTGSDRIAYPALPEPLQAGDLVRLFTPTSVEIDWASSVTRSERTRCHVLTLLKVFQTLGRFISPNGIPGEVVNHVARCAGVPEVQANAIFSSRPTLYRHQHLVLEYMDVSRWNASAQQQVENTIEALASVRTHPADLLNGAIEMLLRERVELPALSTLRRIAGAVMQRVHDRLLLEVHGRLSEQDQITLDGLLKVPADSHESMFAQLCHSPGRATRKNLRKLIDRWYWLQSLVDPTAALAGMVPAKIEQWSDEGRRLTAAELAEYRTPRRHALLLSVIYIARGRLLDDLVSMLTKIMLKLQHRSEDLLEAWQAERREASERLIELLRSLVGAYQSAEQPAGFHRAASAVLDEAGGAEHVMARCNERLQHRSGGWPAFTDKAFRSQRAVLLDLANVLPLKAKPGADNLLEALDLVVSCRSYREEWIQAPIDTSFLPRQWRKRVRGESKSELYHRRNLEIAVCFALANALKSGEVYVPGSCSYGDYTEFLFPIESEPQAVADYLRDRDLPPDAEQFAGMLRGWLGRAIRALEQMVREQWIPLDRDGKPVVSRQSSNGQPHSATELEQKVLDRLPPRTILEALYNTDRWTRWTRQFGPPARMGPQLDNPSERYVLTSFAYGCGLGPTQASRHFKEPVPPHLLTFANRRHMDADTLRAASNDLINFYASFELPSCWGSGESAAADGTLVPTYDNNLFAAHHVRYGRTGGIAYRHIADNYVALFSHFIPCGVHEAVYILDGLLKNTSDVQPSRLHADTHGQSTVVFALAYLLDIELLPRIRNWRALTLFSAEQESGCCYTDHLYGQIIDWDLIIDHWEDYLRVVLAIQSGRLSASWILTRLNSHSRNNRLYRALQELGRVVRTVYLIHWIGMDDMRSGVTNEANKVESFHQFSSHLRFGNSGVLRTNEPDEQEKAIIYNELVANAVMLQTVADQTRILRDLHDEGYPVSTADIAYLSPYVTEQLKRFGEYPTRCETEPPPSRKWCS